MTYWSWIVLVVAIQWITPRLNPKGYQKGKLFTMPLRKRIKFFDSFWCRFKQITCVLFPFDLFLHVTVGNIASYVYFMSIIILYLDDYMTNDDNLKRWMTAVRNKVKWKMILPVPTPADSKVGS